MGKDEVSGWDERRGLTLARTGRQARAASSYSSREGKASIITNCFVFTTDTSLRVEAHHALYDEEFDIRATSEDEG